MSTLNRGKSSDREESHSPGSTRREALGVVALGTTGALMFPRLLEGAAGSSGASPLMLRMSHERWAEFIGKSFSAVNVEDGRVETLRLEEVVAESDLAASKPASVRQTAISLIFSTSRPIADSRYQLRHSQLGSARLYVHATRRGQHAEQLRYQTVLN